MTERMASKGLAAREGACCRVPRPKKSGGMMTKKRGERLFLFFLLLFPISQVLVFYVGVNVNSVLLAFQKYDTFAGNYGFIGFENFRVFLTDLISSPIMTQSWKNSALLYLVGLLISTPLNILISYCLFKKIPLKGLFRVVLFLPSIIPGIVFVLVFRHLVEFGLPNLFRQWGVDVPNFLRDSTLAFPTIIVYGLWTGFGVGIVLYTNAMTRIPDSLVEYGELEGIKSLRELWHVVLPMIFPTITTFLVTGVAGLFTNSAAVYAFYGEGADASTYTFGYYFFIKVIGSKASPADYPYAAAAGLVFTLVAAPVTLLVKYLLERFGPSAEY